MTCRVLLVEDEKWVRTALRKVLEQSNLPLEVLHEASNGMEAWDWLASHEADLVLTDIRMPVMDGLALLQEMKQSRHPADVMIVSGHDDFAYAQQALRLGARDYLLKPVETDEVIRRIGPWLAEREERERSVPAANGAIGAEPEVRWEELSPVEQVLHHIHAKRSFRLTLAEAADMVHLNPSYFSKLFRKRTAATFTDYMTTVRIREAARLLERTSLRVAEIAERLGFADVAYFSNTFKKITGHTPSEYRKERQLQHTFAEWVSPVTALDRTRNGAGGGGSLP